MSHVKASTEDLAKAILRLDPEVIKPNIAVELLRFLPSDQVQRCALKKS